MRSTFIICTVIIAYAFGSPEALKYIEGLVTGLLIVAIVGDAVDMAKS